MAKTRTRNAKGRFTKSSGKRTTALSRRSSSSVVVVRAPSTAVRRRSAPRRRSSSGGSSVGGLLRYIASPRVDDLIASAALGFAVNRRRSTVETLINYAPESLRGVGAYGVLALMSGVAHHMGVARKYTGPLARAASIIAANKLATRGTFFGAGDLNSSLSGDDDLGDGDTIDVGAFDDDVGDDDVGDDDVGDDDDGA